MRSGVIATSQVSSPLPIGPLGAVMRVGVPKLAVRDGRLRLALLPFENRKGPFQE